MKQISSVAQIDKDGLAGASKMLHGHLELICSADAFGRSYLSHQSFNAPFHLSKPYWDGKVLTAQMVNSTAGLFAHDTLRCEVTVEAGASLNITTPSATRVFTMTEGRAEVRQRFSVARGARFAFLPSMLVAHWGSRYRQMTRIDVEGGGELFWVETLAPGRVAHGECFAFEEVDFQIDLRCNGRLNARERFRLEGAGLRPLPARFATPYWSSCYLLSDRLGEEDEALERIRGLHSEEVWVGLSRLAISGWSIKLIAGDSCRLSQALVSLRQILAERLPALVALAPR